MGQVCQDAPSVLDWLFLKQPYKANAIICTDPLAWANPDDLVTLPQP